MFSDQATTLARSYTREKLKETSSTKYFPNLSTVAFSVYVRSHIGPNLCDVYARASSSYLLWLSTTVGLAFHSNRSYFDVGHNFTPFVPCQQDYVAPRSTILRFYVITTCTRYYICRYCLIVAEKSNVKCCPCRRTCLDSLFPGR